MKFAAIALMAVAMFAAEAEAGHWKRKGVTAKCNVPASDVEGAIKGGFWLSQRLQGESENAKPIRVGGKVWKADWRAEYTAQLYADAECGGDGGDADGDALELREKRGRWRSTILKGKIGDGSETQVNLID